MITHRALLKLLPILIVMLLMLTACNLPVKVLWYAPKPTPDPAIFQSQRTPQFPLQSHNAPVWWISLVLGAVGVLLFLKIIKIAVLAPYTFWLVAAGLALLLLATALKKL